MAVNTYYCISHSNPSRLSYSINPGGSASAVRTNPTGSLSTGCGIGLYDQPVSKFPYYAWNCSRSIAWWDFTAYENPGLIISAVLRFITTYVSTTYGSAGSYLCVVDDEGDVADYSSLATTDYGKWLNNNTVLGTAPEDTWSLFDGNPWDATLNSAGIAHINWGGLCAFVFRGNNDVYGSGPDSCFMNLNGPSDSSSRPRILLTVLDSPYVPFKGLFLRGNEVQAVFSSVSDGITRAYRSPDMGSTWYPISGMNDEAAIDIGFDSDNPQNTFAGGVAKLHKFDHADGEVYNMTDGADIVGTVTEIDVDQFSPIAVVGTTSKLYKTTDYGVSVHELLDIPVSAVAIGGLETVAYSAPPTSGMVLRPNSDWDVYYKSGFFGWSPSPSVDEGSYYANLLYQDADWNPGGTWGYYENGAFLVNDMTSLIQCYVGFTNLSSSQKSTLTTRGVTEVRVTNYAGRNSYTYGDIEPKIYTHSTYYTAGVRELSSGAMQPYTAVSIKNPNTGVDWTTTEIDGVVGGAHAGDVASFGAAYIDQIYLEIYYEGGGTKSIGNTPIVRETTVSCANTILASRPAPVTGTINSIELYAATDFTSCRVGVFYSLGGGAWATRAWYDVGAVLTGYHSYSVNLAVTAGDRIGIYADGSLEADFAVSATYDGYYVSSGNVIPTTSSVFSGPTARAISIRGIIYS